jgi:hypothetical protein
MIKFCLKGIAGIIIGIYAFYFIFLSEREIDLKNDPVIKEWIGKKFELKKGVFIHKYNISKGFYLKIPGIDGWLPSNIEEYDKDPEMWQTNYPWVRSILPGTHLRITRIYREVTPAVADMLIIEVAILDGPYKGYHASAQYLFDYEQITERRIFGPKKDILQILN